MSGRHLQLSGTARQPCAYEELTVAAVAIAPNAANVAGAIEATVFIEGGPIRYRVDGTAPTAAIGTPLYDLDTRDFSKPELDRVQFIRMGSVNGLVRLEYRR